MDEESAEGDVAMGGGAGGSARVGVAWRCRECGQVLGVGVGRMLLLSVSVAVEASIRVQCRGCWGWQAWYPPGEGGGAGVVRWVG